MHPIHLERLLEIYCSLAAESCPHVMRATGTCRPLDELHEQGMIQRIPEDEMPEFRSHGWRVTAKGRAYVEALLATPMPEPSWAVPVTA